MCYFQCYSTLDFVHGWNTALPNRLNRVVPFLFPIPLEEGGRSNNGMDFSSLR